MQVLKNRQEKVYQLLEKEKFNKAIIGDPMSIYYFTGIHISPYERFYGLVIDTEVKTLTMINPSVDTGCMKGLVREVTYQDSNGPREAISKVVGTTARLAVETKYFTMFVGDMFHSLGCEVFDIGNCIAKLRMYKDEKEIEQMQFAAKIVDEAIAHVSKRIIPGMTEIELNRLLYSYMSAYPGFITDEFIILVLAAGNSANPHGVSTEYAFKTGDIVLMDFCAYYNYYWSDITRCVFVREIGNEQLAEIYNIAVKANLAAIAAVKPGAAAKDIDKAARDVIKEAGYGEQFIHRTGHGLGLSVHEEPYITSENELILEEGMTFTIEPGIYIKGVGGVRIEDDVLVTRDGCRVLTTTSKHLEDHIIK